MGVSARPDPGKHVYRPFGAEDGELLALWLRKAGLRVPPDLAAGNSDRLRSDPQILLRTACDRKGETPVGFSRLDLAPDATAEITLIVDPELRGRGLGRGLLEDALQQGRELELRRLFAVVEEHNTVGLGFFVSAGFERTGVWLPGFVHLNRILHRSTVAEQRPLEIDP